MLKLVGSIDLIVPEELTSTEMTGVLRYGRTAVEVTDSIPEGTTVQHKEVWPVPTGKYEEITTGPLHSEVTEVGQMMFKGIPRFAGITIEPLRNVVTGVDKMTFNGVLQYGEIIRTQ